MDFILFLISVSGLTLILNKSHLFKGLREFITIKDTTIDLDIKSKHYGTKKQNYFWWFLNSLLSCCTCMGVWMGFVIYLLKYQTFDLNLFLYSFSASMVTTILVSLIQFLDRK